MTDQIHEGGCHCGRVRFRVVAALGRPTTCNCSICAKKGAIHHRVAPEDFELLSGEADLALYQFGTMTARHLFCRHCGIHPFSRPRAAPDAYTVNLRCLDGFDEAALTVKPALFDGRRWEEAVGGFDFKRG